MRKDITVTAEPRDTRGKNEARRLRVRGLSPAVVYGAGRDPVAVAVSPKEVDTILRSSSGHNTIFNLDIQGDVTPVMIVDWQTEPIRDRLLHVDLQRIDLGKRLTVKVPVHTKGDPRGVKEQGGIFDVVTREVQIECLPDDIPSAFDIDVTQMTIGVSFRASDLPLTGSMKLLTTPDAVIAHVVAPRGESTADDATAAGTAEPEVIKKGKKEAEGEAKPDAKKKK
jgi:large subunit ribosomal protein L25